MVESLITKFCISSVVVGVVVDGPAVVVVVVVVVVPGGGSSGCTMWSKNMIIEVRKRKKGKKEIKEKDMRGFNTFGSKVSDVKLIIDNNYRPSIMSTINRGKYTNIFMTYEIKNVLNCENKR